MGTLLTAWWVTSWHIIAADEPGGGEMPGISGLAQYGPGGVLAAVFAAAWWWQQRDQKETLRLERARGDRLESVVHEKYIPATAQMLSEATKLAAVTADTTRALQDLLSEATKLAAVTAETTRVLQVWRDRDR